jgi:hypothetical protein
MTTISTVTVLRNFADLLDAHPDLPAPYISIMSGGRTADAHWYLHINDHSLDEQKATAAQIVRILGGKWDKKDRFYNDALEFNQVRGRLTLQVVVTRAAICERVVIGTREVMIEAVPARPATKAAPGRVEVVEDVEWVCSSLLASEPVSA